MKQAISVEEAETTHQECVEKIPAPAGEHEDVGATIASSITARIVTAEENRKVLKRIDLVLMPLMFISYGLQYMDKALLGSSAQFGIIQDLGLYDVTIVKGVPKTDLAKFSYATLIFYWGFIVGCKFVIAGIMIRF